VKFYICQIERVLGDCFHALQNPVSHITHFSFMLLPYNTWLV